MRRSNSGDCIVSAVEGLKGLIGAEKHRVSELDNKEIQRYRLDSGDCRETFV